jgi:light-regulated signal transduction histidine kinase (bacteriophytochrome)
MSVYLLFWKCLSVLFLCLALLIILNDLFVIRRLSFTNRGKTQKEWKLIYTLSIPFILFFFGLIGLTILGNASYELTMASTILLIGSFLAGKMIKTSGSSVETLNKVDDARRFLSEVFQEMGNLMIVTDENGVITMANKTTEKLLGKTEEKLIGQKAEEFFLQELFELPDTSKVKEIGLLLPELKELPLQVTVNHVTTQGKSYFLIVGQDISHLKMQEKQLKEYLQKIERSNKDLEQFSYVAAHDLKAPLRAIHNLAVFIEEDLGKLPDHVKMNVELLKGRIHRMEGLVNGILEYARSGTKAVNPEITDVANLVNDIVDHLGILQDQQVEIQEGLPIILTQRLLLEQVLSNLMSNAHKYNDNPEPKITIASRELDKEFEFSVSDNGPGIPIESQHKVFRLFQTLQARDTCESTGIGLSIVKKIIEEKGCKIELDSSPGEGCTFRFTWPKLMI